MSVIVCGKRSFFEEVESASPPVYKRLRCSSGRSPVRFSYSPPVRPSPVDQLQGLFPDLEIKLLEKAFEESGNEVSSAINVLRQLQHRYAKSNSDSATAKYSNVEKGTTLNGGDTVPLKDPQPQNNIPVDGAEWVDLIVKEMMNSSSIDDAKSRAAQVLETLEKSISAQASAQAAEGFHKENVILKEQIEVLLRDNAILKRAVAIQHERQKEYDEKNQEALHLKQLVARYQEQLRTLEVKNYALTLHLHQAQQSSSIPGHFNRDVF